MKSLYCLGFIFDHLKKRVVLIEKNKPDWQAGKMNGVGGRIEFGELPLTAMVRETKEEAGIETSSDDWTYLGQMTSASWSVFVYACVVNRKKFQFPKIVTEGRVEDWLLSSLPKNVINNLTWLIPMALDHLEFSPDADNHKMDEFCVTYRMKG